MRTWHFSNFYFFYFATIGIIMPYWGLYLDHLGFTAKEIGQLMALFLFTKMLAPNIWAIVADKLALKHGSSLGLLKFATFATVLVYLLMGLAEGFWQVALVMLGYCVFWNASLPQLEAATLNHLNDKRQYGRIRLWGSNGFIVTVSAVGFVMDYEGPSAIFPAGAIALAALFFASLLMRTGAEINSTELKKPKPNQASFGEQDKAYFKQPLKHQVKPLDKLEMPPKLSQLLNTKVVILLFLCLLMQLSHAPLQTFMSIYLSGYGYTNFEIGLLWTTGVVFEIGIFIYAYQLLSRFSLDSLLTFTFLVAALRWLLIGIFPEIPLVVFLTQAMHAITFGLYHAVMMQFIDRLFVGEFQIRGQALYSSITFGLGGAIGSFASGYIWTDYGEKELFMLSGLMMAGVAAFSCVYMRRLTNHITD